MSSKHSAESPELQGKEAVERAIVMIYDVAYTRATDLTPIDQAVDLIREALGIRLVDCDQCGETILLEHGRRIPDQVTGDEIYLCHACAKEHL